MTEKRTAEEILDKLLIARGEHPSERQRIEKEAKSIYDKIMRFDDGNEMRAYIAGATAEHERNAKLISSLKDEVTYLTATGSLMIDSDDEEKMANHIYQLLKQIKEARNQAIDECIEVITLRICLFRSVNCC